MLTLPFRLHLSESLQTKYVNIGFSCHATGLFDAMFKPNDKELPYIMKGGDRHHPNNKMYYTDVPQFRTRRSITADRFLDVFDGSPLPILLKFGKDSYLVGKGFLASYKYPDSENNDPIDKLLILVTYDKTKPVTKVDQLKMYVSRDLFTPEFKKLYLAIRPFIDEHPGEVILTRRIYDFFGSSLIIPKFKTVSQQQNFMKDIINRCLNYSRETHLLSNERREFINVDAPTIPVLTEERSEVQQLMGGEGSFGNVTRIVEISDPLDATLSVTTSSSSGFYSTTYSPNIIGQMAVRNPDGTIINPQGYVIGVDPFRITDPNELQHAIGEDATDEDRAEQEIDEEEETVNLEDDDDDDENTDFDDYEETDEPEEEIEEIQEIHLGTNLDRDARLLQLSREINNNTQTELDLLAEAIQRMRTSP